jgi:hypothetical protein
LKYRNELKFYCSEAQLAVLDCRLQEVCSLDPHAGSTGTYRIRSLYFDDYNNRYYYENEDGVDPREKYRIRIYNENPNRITLECKRKLNGLNYKETASISSDDLAQIIDGNIPLIDNSNPLLNKFYIKGRTSLLRPKVIVQYERKPYIYGNVRITFDRYISASNQLPLFLNKDINLQPVMPCGIHILEVKYDEFLPHFIYDLLQTSRLQWTAFSKYYICRSFYLNQTKH